MNDAQFQLIAAFQEARLAKALDDHLVARVDRQRETGELDRAVLEEHRAWAKKMGGGGTTGATERLAIRKSAFKGGSMNATMKNQVSALDASLDTLEKSIAKVDAKETRLGKARTAPEGRPVTRQAALGALSKCVKAGSVGLQTAGKIEARVNAGTLAPATLMKAIHAAMPGMRKSAEVTVEDAKKAISQALQARVITLEEGERAVEYMKSGRSNPEEVLRNLTAKVNERASEEEAKNRVPTVGPNEGYKGLSPAENDRRNARSSSERIASIRAGQGA